MARTASPTPMMQELESRRLLSFAPLAAPTAAGSGPFSDPTIQADQKALRDATHTLITDNRAGRKTIRADQQAIREELKQLADDKGQDAIDAALQPLKDKLHADERAARKEIRAASREVSVAKRAGLKTIVADIKAWREARAGGDQTAIDAAKKKLDDDKAQLQTDLKPLRDALVTVQDKWRATLKADHDAITDKLAELDPDLAPLFDKLDTDADALKTKLDADQQKVADAGKKLADDLKAWREAHKPDDTANA
jgi:hypothetical protein